MESSEVRRRRIKQSRRKERAEKVEAERIDEENNESPPVKKKPRKRPTRKPVAEEDIIDGFSILAFKNYDDLNRAIKLAEEEKKLCVQLLGSQEGSDCKDKEMKTHPTKPKKSNKKKIKKGDLMLETLPMDQTKAEEKSQFIPKKLSPTWSTGPLKNLMCESDFNGDKVSDGCSDLFAPPRKGSSPYLPDNLHGAYEEKVISIQWNHIHQEKSSTSASSTSGASSASLDTQSTKDTPDTPNPDSNGVVGGREFNGHSEGEDRVRSGPQTLFTPYATTAITRVSTPFGPSLQPDTPTDSPPNDRLTILPSKNPTPEPLSTNSGANIVVPIGRVSPKGPGGATNKSAAFGSIARLLDSSSRRSPNQGSQTGQAPPVIPPSSRNHSPRGHSPSRDSFSSNVSSLSRTSVTPVSSNSVPQLPPNLSPLQSLSYSKAASWLSVPGVSPVPRRTPPQPQGNLGPGSQQVPTSHHSVFPNILSSAGILSPHGGAMFAPPILPLNSISSHSGSPFGSPPDSLFHGVSSSSELVRRDLESRFISGDRGGGGGGFMGRPGEMHPLLPPLPPMHLQQGNSGQPNPPTSSHAGLFPPPIFKDFQKVGFDPSFYRGNIGLPYPSFNGMLTPPNMQTPFAPPNQMSTFTPKKTGRWNAMHVRIAWEIYQHQQKTGEGGKMQGGKSTLSPSLGSGIGTTNTDHLRPPPPNPVYNPMGREGNYPIMSPHPPHRPPFDPSMFLNTPPHLGLFSPGPPLPRYPSFNSMGPTFGGLGGLGSNLLGRDLSGLAAAFGNQDPWQRMQRSGGLVGSPGLMPGWQMPRPERETKTPTESRREKFKDRHEFSDKRDSSPLRDRSPVRPSRTPHENGDTDSRSSRSSDSHSAVQPSHSHKFPSRTKEEPNGDPDKHQEKMVHTGYMGEKPPPIHPPTSSRLFPPMGPGWETFGSSPRLSSAESFRLSLLQLSDRELGRGGPPMRPPLFPNGPYGLSMLGIPPIKPNHVPLPPPGPLHNNNSSQNGPKSPKSEERGKTESHSR